MQIIVCHMRITLQFYSSTDILFVFFFVFYIPKLWYINNYSTALSLYKLLEKIGPLSYTVINIECLSQRITNFFFFFRYFLYFYEFSLNCDLVTTMSPWCGCHWGVWLQPHQQYILYRRMDFLYFSFIHRIFFNIRGERSVHFTVGLRN